MRMWTFIAVVTLVATTHAVRIARSETTIVVNIGSHPSAAAASQSEAGVNWLDADRGDDTICTESFAAVELQRYLRRTTGRAEDFIITDDDAKPEGELILVGGHASNATSRRLSAAMGIDDEQLTHLGPQGYRIKTAQADGRRVTMVAGGSRVGTLYGVYDLLHRMGCRWFGPDAFQEEIPSAAWNPAFDVTERPSFTTRGFYIYEERGTPEFWQWMARNRLNDWCIQVKNPALLRKLGFQFCCGSHDAQWRFFSPADPYPYNHPRFDGDNDKPPDPYPVSVQYQGDADKDGRLSRFEAHPEWYPLSGGKRIPGIRKTGDGTNFCSSNAEANAEFMKNYVRALIDGIYRGADTVNFWVLDGGQWCECPKCKELGPPTDRNLLLVRRLDQEVKKAQREGRLHRPISIRFLVYADVLAPPTRPLPTDFDYQTCTATFYPISRCFVHTFDHPTCPRNVAYQKHLHGWAIDPNRHYRGQLVIGEYYNVSRFKSLPICFMHTMANDIPYYHKVGARCFQYMHVTTAHWGNKSLTNYQMARQTWDKDTDCEALWRDFFARRYGPAAEPMRQFYESLEKMLSNVEPLKGWSNNLASRLNAGAKDLFNESHLRYRREPGVECDAPTLVEMIEAGKACRALISKAMAIPVPERIKARIAEDERMFTYGERTLAYFDACCQAFELGRAGKLDEARGHWAEAKKVAELLRQDTWSPALAFNHDEPFELNAFNSTYATGALTHLEKLLGEAKPATGK